MLYSSSLLPTASTKVLVTCGNGRKVFAYNTVAQKSVSMFMHFHVIVWLWVKVLEYHNTRGTCFKALHQGLNLRYAAWEIEVIKRRYDNSILVTYWDTYLSISIINIIFIILVRGGSSFCSNHCCHSSRHTIYQFLAFLLTNLTHSAAILSYSWNSPYASS